MTVNLCIKVVPPKFGDTIQYMHLHCAIAYYIKHPEVRLEINNTPASFYECPECGMYLTDSINV